MHLTKQKYTCDAASIHDFKLDNFAKSMLPM